jgi:hypothetical protein
MLAADESLDSPTRPMVKPARILLLTGTAPGEPGVGGVILRDLVRIAGAEHCQCCWLSPRHGGRQPFLPELATTVHPRRYETGYRPFKGLGGEVISSLALQLLRPRMIRDACRTVETIAKARRPDYILAVLESPAAIQVALAVHQRTGIPLRSIVWDDVDLFCRQGMFDRWTRARIERDFGRVLKASERVAVICENMQRDYRQHYGIESQILRHGIPSDPAVGTSDARSRDYSVIGFAGSVTAPDCLQSLVQALDQTDWQFNGSDVALRLVGARYLLDSRKPQRIEYFGWRTVTETRALLADCDVLYLPQSFEPESRKFSELSFPTKLSTYVASGRPILLHAPHYASLTEVWSQFELGPACHVTDPTAVRQVLESALQSKSAERWKSEVHRAHEEFLSVSRFEASVQRLIGV